MPSSLSSSSNGTSTVSSATSSSNKKDDSPYSFKNSDVSISTYSYSDTEYKVNGRALVFNGCMKANKTWSALQMCKFDGEIYCKTPLLYNHVVLTIRNASTAQYVPDDYLNLYYGDEEKPTANFLSSKKVSSTVNGVPLYTLTFSLVTPAKYWRLFNDSPNVVYFLSVSFSNI